MVVDVLQAAFPLLRWDQIAGSLDHDGFTVPDEAAHSAAAGGLAASHRGSLPSRCACGAALGEHSRAAQLSAPCCGRSTTPGVLGGHPPAGASKLSTGSPSDTQCNVLGKHRAVD